MTHDYKRHGTTTLFAAFNVLDRTVIGRNMQRHRHQEFIRFLNAIEAEVPAGKAVHVILAATARRCGWTFNRLSPHGGTAAAGRRRACRKRVIAVVRVTPPAVV